MTIEILMPALSPTMEKGTLSRWHVKEGDEVKPGDVIAEIETDKATMEVESVDGGRIGQILIAEGTADVHVNQVIAILLEEGEDHSALQSVTLESQGSHSGFSGHNTVSPSAKAKQEAGDGAASLQPQSFIQEESTISSASRNRIFASPLARRLAKEQGVDLTLIKGSGPHGRIIRRDIEVVQSSKGSSVHGSVIQSRPLGGSLPATGAERIKALYDSGSYEELPHDGMRRAIATRLTESKQHVPHFYLSVDCHLSALLNLRAEMNATAPKQEERGAAYKLSVNDFIIKAFALALQDVPGANATWTEESRLLHKNADVGVAVAVPDGLFTPVVRKAELKSISAISAEIKDLAERARLRKLKPEEYQGGSAAVSNLGMYGIKHFQAIINPPHGTILAVGASEWRPVVREGSIVAEQVMTATLSCDHRVVDGALGAALLRSFTLFIENPLRMLA